MVLCIDEIVPSHVVIHLNGGDDNMNFSIMFLILRKFCGCVFPIQASKEKVYN